MENISSLEERPHDAGAALSNALTPKTTRSHSCETSFRLPFAALTSDRESQQVKMACFLSTQRQRAAPSCSFVVAKTGELVCPPCTTIFQQVDWTQLSKLIAFLVKASACHSFELELQGLTVLAVRARSLVVATCIEPGSGATLAALETLLFSSVMAQSVRDFCSTVPLASGCCSMFVDRGALSVREGEQTRQVFSDTFLQQQRIRMLDCLQPAAQLTGVQQVALAWLAPDGIRAVAQVPEQPALAPRDNQPHMAQLHYSIVTACNILLQNQISRSQSSGHSRGLQSPAKYIEHTPKVTMASVAAQQASVGVKLLRMHDKPVFLVAICAGHMFTSAALGQSHHCQVLVGRAAMPGQLQDALGLCQKQINNVFC